MIQKANVFPVFWCNYTYQRDYNTTLPCYTLPPTQHQSLLGNIPPLFIYLIHCYIISKSKLFYIQEVPVSGIISDVSVFEPLYFWSYTMFRNCFYSNCYLGCDHTGKTTLVENWDLSYPDPQALFILNTF